MVDDEQEKTYSKLLENIIFEVRSGLNMKYKNEIVIISIITILILFSI